MNVDELRAKQAPLKQLYRDKPSRTDPAHARYAGPQRRRHHGAFLHGDVTAGLHKRRWQRDSRVPRICCWRRWSPAGSRYARWRRQWGYDRSGKVSADGSGTRAHTGR